MTQSESLDQEFLQEARAALEETRGQWQRRLDAIRTDRRRQNAPLSPDFADQAVQRENDEALDALDERGRRELVAIDHALDRMKVGSYGSCAGCGESISIARLRAQPTAVRCAQCAGAGAGAS